ncbi:MAG: DEAD/DEAH box helicase family protein [Opitutales bacterium]|nr:DEAD/DEAH box helicase family protein [Opitutales bacterium]
MSMPKFNEDSRVKIPSIVHLTRLGYQYLSLKYYTWNKASNVFPSIFQESLKNINPGIKNSEIERALKDIEMTLENDDLGKVFYERLVQQDGIRLLDFKDFSRNSFHVVTELPCIKEEDEFRPDITLLINGMPLVFIEVKKPNNREGILAERKRMNARFRNKNFKAFFNITQIMMFSNNMEYDDSSPEPIERAFYASCSDENPSLNYFREENPDQLPSLLPIEESLESFILADTNLQAIKHAQEYATNKAPTTPTNRLLTSLFSRNRLAFLLRYSIAYVKVKKGYEKHIMRYPQIFATHAIQTRLDAGQRKGIIWHTQGSGKTALAYYNVKFLTDYFRGKNVIPKFYFIVDRIDLLTQASDEFKSRGLIVHEISSKENFVRDIKSFSAIHNAQGRPEITVVNIQKFEEDPNVVAQSDYNIELQRVYFLDEVHRSYNPKGSFLANLEQSDTHAIKIGLTGTPLLGTDYNSRKLFGDYIHKYYYNASIKDGYTLRLIREDILTEYKIHLAQTLKEVQLLKGSGNRKLVYAHKKFVEPMLRYIVEDFERARVTHDEKSIGAMVICDSAEQAREMHRVFQAKYESPIVSDTPIKFPQVDPDLKIAADEESENYNQFRKSRPTVKTAALILHDEGTKQERRDKVDAFKDGDIDILFVYNMLLTGFDAHRLKKLYLGRLIKAHNLLQALTRVNRTYKDFQYGYVVDFADIEKEFDKTNRAYFDELQSELGDEIEGYSNLFNTAEEIEQELDAVKDILFNYNTENAERFSQQVSEIQDRSQMLEIIKALDEVKALYNVIRLTGQFQLLDQLDFRKLTQLSRIASDRLALINQKIALETASDSSNILNMALEDVVFTFTKIGEEELRIADELKETLRKTRETMAANFDQADPEFVYLREELERLFKKKKLTEITREEMADNIESLNSIQSRARELERKNRLLAEKYLNDAKYIRIHKRLCEQNTLNTSERKLFDALSAFKAKADARILQNAQLLTNESYAKKEMMRLIIEELMQNQGLALDSETLQSINMMVMNEYLNDFKQQATA